MFFIQKHGRVFNKEHIVEKKKMGGQPFALPLVHGAVLTAVVMRFPGHGAG